MQPGLPWPGHRPLAVGWAAALGLGFGFGSGGAGSAGSAGVAVFGFTSGKSGPKSGSGKGIGLRSGSTVSPPNPPPGPTSVALGRAGIAVSVADDGSTPPPTLSIASCCFMFLWPLAPLLVPAGELSPLVSKDPPAGAGGRTCGRLAVKPRGHDPRRIGRHLGSQAQHIHAETPQQHEVAERQTNQAAQHDLEQLDESVFLFLLGPRAFDHRPRSRHRVAQSAGLKSRAVAATRQAILVAPQCSPLFTGVSNTGISDACPHQRRFRGRVAAVEDDERRRQAPQRFCQRVFLQAERAAHQCLGRGPQRHGHVVLTPRTADDIHSFSSGKGSAHQAAFSIQPAISKRLGLLGTGVGEWETSELTDVVLMRLSVSPSPCLLSLAPSPALPRALSHSSSDSGPEPGPRGSSP